MKQWKFNRRVDPIKLRDELLAHPKLAPHAKKLSIAHGPDDPNDPNDNDTVIVYLMEDEGEDIQFTKAEVDAFKAIVAAHVKPAPKPVKRDVLLSLLSGVTTVAEMKPMVKYVLEQQQ